MTDSIVPLPDGDQPHEDHPSSPEGVTRRRVPLTLKVFGVVLGVLLVATIGAAFVRVPYYLLSPGSARATEPLISVEGAESFEHDGSVEFATVSLQKATALQALMGWIDPSVEVVEAKIIDGDNTPAESRKINLDQMASSTEVATAVALDSLGYDVGASGTGARLTFVKEGSPAVAAGLVAGDVVVEADGVPIGLSSELVDVIGSHAPGEAIPMLVERGGEGDAVPLTVVLGAAPDDPNRGYLGVAMTTRGIQYQFPFTVTIDTGNVGGPSAGLAFTLGVIDTLSAESITGGHIVATTGTINPDGTVGPVGGVPQKTVAVRRSGAELFLVPSSEYDQAKEFAGDMQIVSVDTLDEAKAALDAFRAGTLPAS